MKILEIFTFERDMVTDLRSPYRQATTVWSSGRVLPAIMWTSRPPIRGLYFVKALLTRPIPLLRRAPARSTGSRSHPGRSRPHRKGARAGPSERPAAVRPGRGRSGHGDRSRHRVAQTRLRAERLPGEPADARIAGLPPLPDLRRVRRALR